MACPSSPFPLKFQSALKVSDTLAVRNPYGQTVLDFSQIRPLAICPFCQLGLECASAHYFFLAYSSMFTSNIAPSVNLSFLTLQINFLFCSWISLSSYGHPSGPLLIVVWDVLYSLCRDFLFQWVEHELFGDRIDVLFIFEPSAPKIGLTKSKCIELVQAPKRALGDVGWSFILICNGCHRKNWRMNLSWGTYWFCYFEEVIYC